jgi:hypothetical protein
LDPGLWRRANPRKLSQLPQTRHHAFAGSWRPYHCCNGISGPWAIPA